MRKDLHLSLILALAFVLSLSTLALADRAVVNGTVSDERTLFGIEGADLTVWRFTQHDTVGTDITDENGYYWIEMDLAHFDTCAIEAKAVGYRTKVAYFSPQQGDSLEINFSLRGPQLQQFDSSLVADTIAPGDSSLFERVMTNIGTVPFEYTVVEGADWIVVTPTSGTIPWLGEQTLSIWLYAPEEPKAVYEDTIVIENNSASPAIHIPVMMLVPTAGVQEQEGSKVPRNFALRGCYPNPFNASTTIGYDLPRASRVTLEVYNLVGQKVATLVNGYEQAGYKTVNWNAAEVTTGIYYYKLTAGEFVSVRKLTILK
jgi:hypothetical protein